jgi:hypothetical protein
MNVPANIFVLSFLVLWFSGRIGTSFRSARLPHDLENAVEGHSGTNR